MPLQESQTYTFEIVFATRSGELPYDSEIERMVRDQLDGELDPETGLFAMVVSLTGTDE